MDEIDWFCLSASLAPHPRHDWVARQRQTLPQPQWRKRQRLHEPTPATNAASNGKSANGHPILDRIAGREAAALCGPKGLQIQGIAGPDCDVVAVLKEKASETIEVGLRTSQGWRVSLNEVGHPHGRSFADE